MIWKGFIANLRVSHARLQTRPDELMWAFSPTSIYTVDEGYLYLSSETTRRDLYGGGVDYGSLNALLRIK